MSEQSLKLGFIMGLLCPSEKRVEKEPIGYLYGHVAKEGEEPAVGTNRYVVNGVEYIGAIVPKPPVWDTGTFHHTCMFPTRNFISGALLGYTMVFTGEPLFVRYLNGDGHDVLCGDDDGTPYQLFRYVLSSGEWWDADSSGDTDTLSPNASMGVPCWTNYDIVNKDDNSVFLAASDCVCIPIYGDPVAYSYNGVVLPKLPELDRTTYPYVTIGMMWMGEKVALHQLFVTNKKLVWIGDDFEWLSGEAGAMLYCSIRGTTSASTSTTWGVLEDKIYLSTGRPTWANYDILNEDGSLYLAKSDPVPIYE